MFISDIEPMHASREANIQTPGGENLVINTYLAPELAPEIREAVADLRTKLFVTLDENPTSKLRGRYVLYFDEDDYIGLLPL